MRRVLLFTLVLIGAVMLSCATTKPPVGEAYVRPQADPNHPLPSVVQAWPASGIYPIGQGVKVRYTSFGRDSLIDSVTSYPVVGSTQYVYRNGERWLSGPADFSTVEVVR
jgi:hypothetical protein